METMTNTQTAPVVAIKGLKTCSACGKLLPLEHFARTRAGGHKNTCKDCVAAAVNETKAKQRAKIQAQRLGFDSMFDGKQPVEVIDFMSRAKRWLEARGYEITLEGTYTMKKKITFS